MGTSGQYGPQDGSIRRCQAGQSWVYEKVVGRIGKPAKKGVSSSVGKVDLNHAENRKAERDTPNGNERESEKRTVPGS